MPRVIVALFFSLLTSVTAAGPVDGSGGKVVFYFSELGTPIDSDMDEIADLSLDFIAWIQGKTYQIVADLETGEILLEASRHPFGDDLLRTSPDDFAHELLFL